MLNDSNKEEEQKEDNINSNTNNKDTEAITVINQCIHK